MSLKNQEVEKLHLLGELLLEGVQTDNPALVDHTIKIAKQWGYEDQLKEHIDYQNAELMVTW